MKQDIENTMLKASVDYEIKIKKDNRSIHEGCIVQVTNPKNKHIGKIGKVARVWLPLVRRNPYCLIEFSNHKSGIMRASSLKVLSKVE